MAGYLETEAVERLLALAEQHNDEIGAQLCRDLLIERRRQCEHPFCGDKCGDGGYPDAAVDA